MPSKQILVIDDEADIREVAQLSIEVTTDWQVLTAASGTEGLDLAIAYHPDAILLDIMMPGMDGLITWQYLQENPHTQDIPIVFLTAKVQAKEQRRYAQLGATAILTKPFDPTTLGDAIAEVLGWAAFPQ
ncbi:MAG: response regulator [Jaaginema sp. PMC 1079.18]|nr:response regulator [Jaaginema sp. PMC 1080.18]MEC4852455.1 response regulator [Jaaginema sp. PMC 1079.18]MEC4867942.1 response regulator [Jaaginema sp. PMC 1078.18]